MRFPRVVTDLSKLQFNMNTVISMAKKHGIETALVGKCVCADERIVKLMNKTEAAHIADSRIENLIAIETDKPKLLLRISMQSELGYVAKYADISLQSDVKTIRLLNHEARILSKKHKVILMLDMGDLREGVFFRDEAAIFEAARAVVESPALELYGVGVNLTCFGAVLPSEKNLSSLVEIASMLRKRFDIEIPIVSGGNSSSMTLLQKGRIPKGVNHLRIGEAYLLGNDTGALEVIDTLHTDCFTLEAEIVELYNKPSKPIGQIGANAFGEHVEFEDRGEMLRGILAVGRQDIDVGAIIPYNKNVEILGASSDHLIVNLTHCAKDYAIGDRIAFNMEYGALLHAFTSPYIHREYLDISQ